MPPWPQQSLERAPDWLATVANTRPTTGFAVAKAKRS